MQFRSDYHKKKVLDIEMEAIIKLDFSIEEIEKLLIVFSLCPSPLFMGL